MRVDQNAIFFIEEKTFQVCMESVKKIFEWLVPNFFSFTFLLFQSDPFFFFLFSFW